MNTAESTSHAAKSGHAAEPRVNPGVIMPFVKSTQRVFSTMIGMEASFGKPHLKKDHVASYDVSGIIGFSGALVGSVVITMQAAIAVKIVTGFAGAEFAIDSSDFADAIGELANMIAGSAKKDLNLGGNISTPTVIIGAGHMVARLSGVPCIVIPCHTPVGDFAVEVNIRPE